MIFCNLTTYQTRSLEPLRLRPKIFGFKYILGKIRKKNPTFYFENMLDTLIFMTLSNLNQSVTIEKSEVLGKISAFKFHFNSRNV